MKDFNFKLTFEFPSTEPITTVKTFQARDKVKAWTLARKWQDNCLAICGRNELKEHCCRHELVIENNPKPLSFIDLVDETGRTSSLGIYGKKQAAKNKLTICVIGNLPHCTEFTPKTIGDADRLIEWLNDWKESQLGK
jgi:hypothetical protein